MYRTRREFMARIAGMTGAAGIMLAIPERAHACLYGKWAVLCPNNHVNIVDDGTCQHVCENCYVQVFSGNVVTVVCINGHPNRITTGGRNKETITQHYICPTCYTDCRLG